jgi:Na+/H+-translocating membrane pyrophosphatase
MYGIGLTALGMLSTLAIGLTIDAYGPISDNAGGIAEMSYLGKKVRDRTDALDSAGNTTAAIGKGFAIGSAALVAMALFGAFITRQNNKNLHYPLCDVVVTVTDALIFSGLIIGAMLPYAFSAMTMKAVGDAAIEMVTEIR